jgi:hypothetical protein
MAEQGAEYNGGSDKWLTFDGEVVVYGENSGDIFADGYGLYDIFGGKTKDMAPGDVSDIITAELRNQSSKPVIFYMKASLVNEDDSRRIVNEAEDGGGNSVFPGKRLYEETADAIHITMWHDGAVIYDGPIRGGDSGLYEDWSEAGSAGESGGIELGEYFPGEVRTITARVSVPLEYEGRALDNEFLAEALCAVRWQWGALEEPVLGDSIGNAPPAGAALPPIILTPEPVPSGRPNPAPIILATEPAPSGRPNPNHPDITIIAQPGAVPPVGLPQTGGLRTFAWPIAAVIAALLVLLFATRKKDGKEGVSRLKPRESDDDKKR